MRNYSRRGFMKSLACGGLGLVLPDARAAAAGDRKPPKPNVVMIVIDDLNDYVTGMGGHPQAKTPNGLGSGIKIQNKASGGALGKPFALPNRRGRMLFCEVPARRDKTGSSLSAMPTPELRQAGRVVREIGDCPALPVPHYRIT